MHILYLGHDVMKATNTCHNYFINVVNKLLKDEKEIKFTLVNDSTQSFELVHDYITRKFPDAEINVLSKINNSNSTELTSLLSTVNYAYFNISPDKKSKDLVNTYISLCNKQGIESLILSVKNNFCKPLTFEEYKGN